MKKRKKTSVTAAFLRQYVPKGAKTYSPPGGDPVSIETDHEHYRELAQKDAEIPPDVAGMRFSG